MGSLSLMHWLLVILVIMLLFGRGRISDLMGDFAKGINSFKKGLNEGETPPAPPPQVTAAPQNQANPVTEDTRR
ncbi:twin-arginine translocase TatA/TatE family subunit [Sphingomonas sp. IBVSS1]|jgi:sec-independent protein translocase protein TatA|uniref:Sec-independent protein translocase protein TatA n=1 Tax=Sandarakinorhabdus cyanobacteriorum TaxID=1981098 RepID=A0A255YP82_9SPHN|nr:twin-arginine translocase TatA/TatE family subunit [Sandarakinorhabdus cyanobacteriorum]OSZ71949.1 twin-arginine translocase TatA/TatE family subunit [Sphingomonas sp. IBVSS1]OYQ31003.1 twin-arginine translocase TatA/TatE family subunit [Sandarakinorhabdus cyanobacteriorum]